MAAGDWRYDDLDGASKLVISKGALRVVLKKGDVLKKLGKKAEEYKGQLSKLRFKVTTNKKLEQRQVLDFGDYEVTT